LKHKYSGILLVLFVCVSVPAEAQLFKPFTAFRVIKTDRFDIIFPQESESSARLLASYADRVYDQISSLLGIEYPGRIPVTFAPHTDMHNAYYRPFPGSYIVLFDTPMDLEWTNFANSLESLFLHELTHAVSLNSRSRFHRVLHRIFGNWASPALIYAPLFMVEGVTVSFESLSGFGRANDPLIKQILRQALHEGKFLTPFQASGVYDLPGHEGVHYEYGGLFSAWLQQTYGMEKYAELWQALGKDSFFSFFVYRSGYYRVFKRIYGVDFLDAWKTFSASLALNNLEENSGELLPKKYRFLSEKRDFISALAAHENSVYALNGQEGKIHAYDSATEKLRTFNVAAASYDIDVSPDGAALLVSGYHLMGERYRAVVNEYKTNGRRTGRTIRGLYKARYFRDGVIGIRSELHNTCIVYENFNGNSEILFRGNEELLFSGPQALDNERIVFIAARKGVRELLLYNYVSGELFRVEIAGGGDEYRRYMRGLGVSEGRLFFSHNADDRMYKLAAVNLETMQAVFSERDFSGGVFSPVAANSEIYYRGAFFSGDGFLRFPETTGFISGTRNEISLVQADNENYGAIAVPKTETAEAEPLYAGSSKRYFGIRYMNPLKFWLPLPLIRVIENDDNTVALRLDGGGLASMMSDPTDRNTLIIMAYADVPYRMAMIENITWLSTVPGFPVTAQFSDMVLTDLENDPYRDTRGSLSGVLEWQPGRWYRGFSLGGGYARIAYNDGGESAYTWEETGNAFFLTAGFTLSSLQRRQNELFGTGLYFGVRGMSVVDSFAPRVEGMFQASAETRFPLSLILYGGYDKRGMDLHGVSPTYGQPAASGIVSEEYPHPAGLTLNWIGGGEASIGLFSLEIQKNLGHAYFNRFFGTLSLRNVLYDSKGHPKAEGVAINDMRLAQSLVLKLGLVSSIIPVKFIPIFLEPNIWAAWKFSDTITGEGFPWSYGFGFNTRL
jgi:hypothetical protein